MNEKYKKTLAFLLITFIYSYALKALILNSDLSMILIVILMLVVLVGLFFNKICITFTNSDLFMCLFIVYVILNSVFISSPINAARFIFASLIPYFIGKSLKLDKKIFIFMRKIVNIYSFIIIFNLIFEYLHSISRYRVTFDNTHPVALGELLGIFVIINIVDENGFRLQFKNIILSIIGLLVMLFIIGSRGAFFSTLLTLFIVFFLKTKNKLKISLTVIMVIISYNIITSNEYIINIFPTINRFSFINIINDPSIIGSYRFLGRKDLYVMSIYAFRNNPIFGGGLGIVYAHNFFLEILSGLGLIGIMLIILFILSIFILCFKKKNNINYLLLTLLIQSFIYKQTSFAFDAYKSLFIFAGMFVTQILSNNKK